MKFVKRALLKDVPEGSVIKLTPQGKFYTVGKQTSQQDIILQCNGKTTLRGRHTSVYVCRLTSHTLEEAKHPLNQDN